MEVKYDAAFQKFIDTQKQLNDPWYRQLVGAKLKVLRLSKRLPQNVVAKASGMSESKLCQIEKGAFPVRLEDAVAIARAIDVSLDKFLYEEPEHAAAM